ncbi:hypothetical protein Z946_3956 [Sulfitobacter noctilucicola]|uniref:Uncharacterized protein n=1 Tax=Sulfitobacter noctilucicola TaxID=1342301 RepID=A0A7W6M7Z4_9RHOB|nr:hypothetical protein [Sulfitobacter noctilucicola]KIN65058.1 hypothetical protein Z946_3956 [Sulfitobacter noctilucicola]MBB4173802.1 hypothetical protein [Sulfitobacter noctilucicola]
MALTEYEADWITKTSNMPVAEPELDDNGNEITPFAKREARLEFFLGADSELATGKADIEAAQDFTLDTREKATLWDKVMRRPEGKLVSMKWKADDSDLPYFGHDMRADHEVDTVADVGQGNVEVPETTLNALTAAFDRIMGLSYQMANELDDEGGRMFSDEDIRRELWAPLVREGTIPENLVPQRFSEQAIAFKGAADIYQDRIDDYSKNSHGKEDLLRGLGIAGDTLGVVNTIVGSSVTIGNANKMADLNESILKGTDKDGNVVDKDALKIERAQLQQQEAFVKFGGTVLTGGFGLVKSGVEESAKGEDANWAKFADQSVKVLTSVVAAGIGPIAKEIVGVDSATTEDEGKARMRTADAVKAGVLGGLTACRMVPTLVTVAKAKPGDRRKIVDQMIEQFADAVQLGIQSAAALETDNSRKADMIMVGASVRTLILLTGKSERAIELMVAGKPKEAALLLGGALFMDGAAGVSGLIADGVRKDVTAQEYKDASPEERLYMESTGDPNDTPDEQAESLALAEKKRADAMAALQASVNQNVANVSEDLLTRMAASEPPVIDPAQEAFAKEMQAQINQAQQEKAEAELAKQFGDPEAVAAMFAEFDHDMGEYGEMYETAAPEAALEGEPDQIAENLKAIDRAIANTSALRARAEMINGISSAGAAITASFVPGAGAVVAAQAVAYDIYCLSKAVTMHNKWVDSMEIAFRAGSAYSPAIEKTLQNARITLSHKSVKMVLDSVKLGNEVAKCFDITGTTTIIGASLTMTSALVDYGYKMNKEVEITNGWKAYKKARENTGNRKAARAALRLNSTLAKCCIAYGACMEKDPSAMEAIRISGLSPSVLADDKDVCKKLVNYLENEMSEDPVVMHVERQPKKWQPGKPKLNAASWFETKTAAVMSAEPRLDPNSARTPGMDRLMAQLDGIWEGETSYLEWRAAKAPLPDDLETRRTCAETTIGILKNVISQMDAYAPVQAGTSKPHTEMSDIAQTFRALAILNLPQAETDFAMPPLNAAAQDDDADEDTDEEE